MTSLQTSRDSRSGGRRGLWLIVIAFVIVNAALAYFAVEGATYKYGGDAASWLTPTQALLKHGDFVDPENPERLLTFRPPLYPIFAAAMLWISGGAMWSVVVGQLVLLFATGWIARAITQDLLPGYGNLMLALVIFNPNALGTAHLFQSDTLYAFSVTVVVWIVFAFARAPGWRRAVASGMLLGLSLLVRTTGQYLIYVWPLALCALGMLAQGARQWPRSLAMGAAAAAVAIAVTVPWMLHNQRAGEGFALSTSYLKAYFLWDNIPQLDICADKKGTRSSTLVTQNPLDQLAAEYGTGFEQLSRKEKYDYFLSKGEEQFFTYPIGAYACSFGLAWGQFFGAPGIGNIMNLLGLYEQTALSRLGRLQYTNYYQPVFDALAQGYPVLILLSAAGFAFVAVMRVLGLIGVATIINRRLWAVLLIVGAGVAYFTVIHLFVANSRYRLPLEPVLFLLALYGLDGWRQWRLSSRAK